MISTASDIGFNCIAQDRNHMSALKHYNSSHSGLGTFVTLLSILGLNASPLKRVISLG
jgi:hypothetical protein